MDDQFLEVVAAFRTPTKAADRHTSSGLWLPGELRLSTDTRRRNDSLFLGASVVSLPVTKEGRVPGRLGESSRRMSSRCGALWTGSSRPFPWGFTTGSTALVDHAIFGEHNPLLLGTGRRSDGVAIYCNGQPIPPLADRLEDTAALPAARFPGVAIDPAGLRPDCPQRAGGLALRARSPARRLFRPPDRSRRAGRGGATAESKVVVQPDYSIVIIGPSAAPAAELLPFCERTSAGSRPGALVLKITRESVLQAIGRGLPPAEVLVRLKRHASHELPANVVREVEGWAGWVRQVALERLTVLRCPDRETADRVMGALPKQAERIHETMVAIAPSKLTTVERQKLLGQGIIVRRRPGGAIRAEPRPKAKPKPKTRQKAPAWSE